MLRVGVHAHAQKFKLRDTGGDLGAVRVGDDVRDDVRDESEVGGAT